MKTFHLWAPDNPSDEVKWNRIKAYRDKLLAHCDWTQINDAVLNLDERSAWQNYRQALRDIPQDYATPDAVVWPQEPK